MRLDAKTNAGSTPIQAALLKHPSNAPLLALLSGQGPAHPPGTVCDHCAKTMEQAGVTSFKSCSACHNARYCNASCGAAAWPAHKAACKARKAERDDVLKFDTVDVGALKRGGASTT